MTYCVGWHGYAWLRQRIANRTHWVKLAALGGMWVQLGTALSEGRTRRHRRIDRRTTDRRRTADRGSRARCHRCEAYGGAAVDAGRGVFTALLFKEPNASRRRLRFIVLR